MNRTLETLTKTRRSIRGRIDTIRENVQKLRSLRESKEKEAVVLQISEAVKKLNVDTLTLKKHINEILEQSKPSEIADLLAGWDESLQSVGDDAQLANVDMQNMLQKQQQTMQMMSQISKMLHDTAMAVVRKMGG